MVLMLPLGPPFYQILIDFVPHIHKTLKGDHPKTAYRNRFEVALFFASGHSISSLSDVLFSGSVRPAFAATGNYISLIFIRMSRTWGFIRLKLPMILEIVRSS